MQHLGPPFWPRCHTRATNLAHRVAIRTDGMSYQVPEEMFDAAMIDGARDFSICTMLMRAFGVPVLTLA
jgi:ABC-type glycerol-3-phosphate transport system permease component